jgi:hypothetical protein
VKRSQRYTQFVAILTPKLATGPCFYKYSATEDLDWLRETILNHFVYFPTLGQLNDPADAKTEAQATLSR